MDELIAALNRSPNHPVMRALFLALLFTVLSGLVAEANAQEQFTHCTFQARAIPKNADGDPVFQEFYPDPIFNACVTALPEKHIYPDDADSTCIGSMRSPLCATETLLACISRRDEALCRIAGASIPRPNKSNPELLKYRVVKIAAAKPEKNPAQTHEVELPQSGVWLVDIHRSSCLLNGTKCLLDESRMDLGMATYELKRIHAQWKIISWWIWVDH